MEKAQEYISSVYYGDMAISAVIMIVAGGFILFLDRILNISLELVISVIAFSFCFSWFRSDNCWYILHGGGLYKKQIRYCRNLSEPLLYF